jgi:hypothetical protein
VGAPNHLKPEECSLRYSKERWASGHYRVAVPLPHQLREIKAQLERIQNELQEAYAILPFAEKDPVLFEAMLSRIAKNISDLEAQLAAARRNEDELFQMLNGYQQVHPNTKNDQN